MKFLTAAVAILFAFALTILLAPDGTSSQLPPDAAPIALTAPAVEEKPASRTPSENATIDAEKATIDVSGIEGAWRDWMSRYNIRASAMTLGRGGQILHSMGEGRRADTTYPIASLSKAITAMCLNDIMDAFDLSWSSTLGDLAPALTKHHMPPHPGATALSLGDLVTHTTGWPKNVAATETAGEGRNLYTQQHFAREALTNPAHQSADHSFTYSNTNFAVLGQIISVLSGRPYGEICKARIMGPAGASQAAVAGRMWATGGFGGWSASTEDYARFLMHWFAPEQAWMLAPENFGYDSKSGAGLGVFHRKTPTGKAIQHNGMWRSKKPARQHGALFVMTETGTTFVVNWQGQLPNTAYRDLRAAIIPQMP